MGTGHRIFLHAGAHRTGTSSFQMCLALNRDALNGIGLDVAYPKRDGIPGGSLALRLPDPRHGLSRQEEFANRIGQSFAKVASGRGLILSDENIPGSMRHFRKGRFYPAAEARLDVLRRGLGDARCSLLYVVRSHDDLFVSSYRKRAEDNPVPPFSELAPRYMEILRGWPEIIAAIRDVLRPDELTVVDYRSRGSSSDLLRRLVPQATALDLTEPDRSLNLSATDAALEELQRRYRSGERLARRQWRAVIAEHADDATPRGFAAFSQADAAHLRGRHARDLARLAEMPGVRLVAD